MYSMLMYSMFMYSMFMHNMCIWELIATHFVPRNIIFICLYDVDVSYAGCQPCKVKAEWGPQLRKGRRHLLYHTKDLKWKIIQTLVIRKGPLKRTKLSVITRFILHCHWNSVPQRRQKTSPEKCAKPAGTAESSLHCDSITIYIFCCGAATQRGLWPPHSWGFKITHNNAPQSVGLLWTSDQLVAEFSTWQHTTITTDKHPCHLWDSNPQSQQASGRRPTS
jgi:hypothetical protein